MNDTISEVVGRKQNIMPIVRFERMAIENHAESLRVGRYMAHDVDYVFITPPYSKDEVVKEAKAFLDDNERKVLNRQIPADAADHYRRQYEAWKNGQELPPNGTPIRGWAMISPAQQAMLIDRKIMTVELLSTINDEGMRLIGMGANEMRQMAKNWLAQANDKGPLTMEMTKLQSENELLKGSIENLTKQVHALKALVESSGPAPGPMVEPSPTTIAAQDILDEPEVPSRPNRKR